MSDHVAEMNGALRPLKPWNKGGGQEADIDLRSLFFLFWRRKVVILSCVMIGLSFAVIGMSFMRSHYTANALVILDNNPQQKALDELQTYFSSSLRLDSSLILSEIEVIKSRNFALKVVKKLNLMADPELNPRIHNAAMSDQSEEGGKNFKALSVYGTELERLPEEFVDKDVDFVITQFLSKMNVRSVQGSNAIKIEYVSVNPSRAALIANTIADTYVEQRLEQKYQATKKVTDWLDNRLTNLRAQVQEADAEVVKYKEKYNLSEGVRNVPMSSEQISALNAQLVSAKAKRAEAAARLVQLKEIANNIQKIETTPEIINSSLIQNYKSQKVKLEARLSELSLRYGEKHPALQQTKTELKDLNQQIREEMLKIARSTESEVLFADASVKALETGLAENQGQQYEDNTAMIGLRDLERQAEATRLIYEKFLSAYKKSDRQEELQSSEARVISYAVPPQKPSYPNKPLLLSLSLAISAFIGLAIALLTEKMDNSFRSINQLENTFGYPCYALIPSLQNMSQQEMANYIVSKPSSALAESVRTLRTVLNLRVPANGEKPRIVTITSSFPGEGKTTLSVWLGRLAAKSGEKVLVIDADLRRPNIHRAMGKNNESSLVDYLTGEKSLEEVVQKDDASGVYTIMARSVPNSALDLINSDKMARLLEAVQQEYDLVIVDSPACLAVSDARVLAKMSDQLLYVVGWDQTPREVVISGVKQFSDIDYENIAFVLTNVDVQRHARYGYGDTAYYYGRYREYYSN